MFPIDYHIHTSLCRHARGSPIDYAANAYEKKLRQIAFTDHIPIDGYDPQHRMRSWELGLYHEEITKAQKTFPKMTIKKGFEVDFTQYSESAIHKALNFGNIDYLIGSVHYIDGFYVGELKAETTGVNVYIEKYLCSVEQLIKSKLFDIVGHLDIFSRNDPSLSTIFKDDILKLLPLIKNSSMALEINTSGYRCGKSTAFPSREIVAAAIDAAIPLTIGSDAHSPEETGYGFNRILLDYPEIKQGIFAVYSNRIPSFLTWNEVKCI